MGQENPGGVSVLNTRPYITTRELAEAAAVSDAYIRQLIGAGKLKAEKAGGVWLIAREDAARWMQSRKR